MPARFVLFNNGGEKESFTTDTGRVIPLREILTRDITLETGLIPQYVLEKLYIASAHDNLVMNGLPVAQQEKGENESKLTEQNRMYTYSGVYRLNSTTIITDESGIVSSSGDVLGADSGLVIGV